MKVTRVAYSADLNASKYARLVEQARRLGRVRSEVWQRYGSVSGARLSDRQIRDMWLAEGTAARFGVLANAWKETLRDAVADIAANRSAAKAEVRKVVNGLAIDVAERKRLFVMLKSDTWTDDPMLSRHMRKHWRRGRNRTHDQIVVRSDQYRTFTLADGGDVWLAVPGLVRRQMVRIPLNTAVAPTGTLRLILRHHRVEVHYQIDASTLKSSARPAGSREIGIDKGYSEVLTDSDGVHHGTELGALLSAESDHRRNKCLYRAKIRSVAEKAIAAGDRGKAERIARNNLGTAKRHRRSSRWQQTVRTATFRAVHAVVDKASMIAAEDLTKTFTGDSRRRGPNVNRRMAAWTKGITAEALANVSERRGSVLTLVNAAYTSQVGPCCRALGRRSGDRLHCTRCGVVWHADHAAAINVLHRVGDPDITLHTSHQRGKRIVQERADRQPDQTADPGLQPSSGGGERIVRRSRVGSR
ncbi:transposase [Kibdelosporangium philippinense]|uniref:Transposase n=1 Tax=Kibdelosporangium philippinense TaxID=211113 RepID=A0ABS8ZPH4_9PSEU|nr:transposase [Kibdelosporangium philippinense]MCE7009457.1 transposase [Kibdelosporangium philippinense]